MVEDSIHIGDENELILLMDSVEYQGIFAMVVCSLQLRPRNVVYYSSELCIILVGIENPCHGASSYALRA